MKTEYLRPWKLVTLLLAILLLSIGSFVYSAPDWDVPITFIMCLLAYLAAPWTVWTILGRRWRLIPAVLFAIWFTVDGSYWIYWHFRDPMALDAMRSANFPVSLALFGLCGMGWFYKGSLRELAADIRQAFIRSDT
jgi:hypothetical protein